MARDLIHDIVKRALVKDGWIITHDPFPMKYGSERVYADLAAERPIGARKGEEKIVVEIKSFVGYSVMQDFEAALGQYLLYRIILAETAPQYRLYLGVSDVTYGYDLQRDLIKFVLQKQGVAILVVDIESEEIVQWIN